jgi:predicted YcjX-like family ATPase
MTKYYVSLYLWEVVDENKFSHLVPPGADDVVIVSIDTDIVEQDTLGNAVSVLDTKVDRAWTKLRKSIIIEETKNRQSNLENT